jgi:hypothetical protein
LVIFIVEWASVAREAKTITLKYKTKKTTTRNEHVVCAAGTKVRVTKLYSCSVHAKEAVGKHHCKKERMVIIN